MRIMTAAATALLSVGLLTACATTDEDASPRAQSFADLEGDTRLGEQVDRICFSRQIDGFGETTRNTVVVDAGVNDYYLLRTTGSCFDLEFAQSIAFDSFSSCLTRGDRLVAFDSAFGPGHGDTRPQRCLITEIYAWDADAESVPEESDASST